MKLKLTRAEAITRIQSTPSAYATGVIILLQFDIPMINGNVGLAGGRGETTVTVFEASCIVRNMFNDGAEKSGCRVPMSIQDGVIYVG